MNEKDIFDKICKGDERALEVLYEKYYRMMTQMVIKNSGTEQEAKDIYQEALVVFWQKSVSGNLVLTSKISTYIYSICQNLWRKELDRKKRLSSEEKDSSEFPTHDIEERAKLINECISQMGDTCKKVLMYYYFDGMSMADISKKLNFSSNDTAKTKKYKCKKKLDTLIKKKYTTKDFFD